MELKELHNFILKELKVKPVKGKVHDFRHKTARMIFCKVARGMGHDSFTIAYFIDTDFPAVNRSIREFNRIEFEKDFISKNIIENYHRIVELVKDKL